MDESTQHGQAMLTNGSPDHQSWMWHRHLDPCLSYLKCMFPSQRKSTRILDCESCVIGKSHKQTYSPSSTHTDCPCALICSNVWGPSPEFTPHEYSYFVIFVDDCTHISWVYFLKQKSKVYVVFVKFYNMLQTQFEAQPQIL